MTDQQRYLFDLHGYLVVPDALTAGQIASLNAMLDERIAREMAPEAATHRFLEPLSWGQPFVDLLDNPPVEPHLTMARCRGPARTSAAPCSTSTTIAAAPGASTTRWPTASP